MTDVHVEVTYTVRRIFVIPDALTERYAVGLVREAHENAPDKLSPKLGPDSGVFVGGGITTEVKLGLIRPTPYTNFGTLPSSEYGPS